MKQGINIKLPVQIEYDLTLIDSIEFIFKQQATPRAKALKTSLFKADNTGDVKLVSNIFYVPWTMEETYLFEPKSDFFMDVRIHLINSLDNPETDIVKLRMVESLFAKGEVVEND